MDKNPAITINGTSVPPGKRADVHLPIADLYTATSVSMPVQVVNGRKPGPVLFVSAAIHGDELNGVEIVRRLLKRKALASLRGALIAVPIVNVHGFLDQSRYLPDRRDLNRSFPGSAKGSVAARLANTFLNEIVTRADYGIDLHTGAVDRSNLPQIRANLDDAETLMLARAFGVPVIINSDVRDGSLRGCASDMGKPVITYEAGEALRFDQWAITPGVRGVLRVMRRLGMLTGEHRRRPVPAAEVANGSSWARAPIDGILRPKVRLGARVGRGELLGRVADPFGNAEGEVRSVADGIVIGMSRLPLANEGEALFHIARFDAIEEAESAIEDFHSSLEPPPDPLY